MYQSIHSALAVFTGFGVALTGTRDDGHDLRALLESARRSVATPAAAHVRLFGLPGA
ncbi:hypothetical protein [Streptomyces californicus]|uniref:hypothetical protein n=1 Tax=Streptomyces californicus TaxID=67351 RepID=UPI000ACDC94F|nr:hypothetical protein [Streptomyces californicus]QRV59538.1 hypothetical protein I6J40_35425 [Streptomyces californicus]